MIRMECTETDSEAPLVIIDGKSYTRKEVGRLCGHLKAFR
ncbi:DUF7713 domain-containing protein [Sporosarcina luteola]